MSGRRSWTTPATKRAWRLLGALALLAALPATAQNVEVHVTADNAYRFGFGPINGPVNLSPVVENSSLAAEIFSCGVVPPVGPEVYTVPNPNPNDYLYIIAYADKGTTQGVIGQFQFGTNPKIYTGVGAWEVCATGNDFDPGSGGPSVALINTDIVKCNANNPMITSKAWVNAVGTSIGKLEVGMGNGAATFNLQPGGEFPLVCSTGPSGIDQIAAKWMWYNWDPATLPSSTQSAFIWPGTTVNTDDEYLIFRLPMSEVPGVSCPTLDVEFQYAVKFACYRANEHPLALVRGVYGTAINVHNPQLTPGPGTKVRAVHLAKKVAVALPGEKVGPISPYRLEALGPDQAFEIDCADILSFVGAPPMTYLTGFLVIDADGPLDVTAIYTGRPAAGDVSTMDVENVPERKIQGQLNICK